MVEPSEEEFKAVAAEFGLHELAVEDAVRAHQRPKVEAYGETIHVVVKTARYVDPDEVIELGEISIFVAPDFVITVRHGDADLAPVRARLEQRPDLLEKGPGAVLYAILDHVVDRYIEAAQGFDDDVREVELQVFSAKARTRPSGSTSSSARCSSSRRRRRRWGKRWKNSAADFAVVPEALHEYFRDVEDHLRRVSTRIENFRELLDSALEANLTQVSMRQNEDMRKISAWVAIAGCRR